MKRFIALVLTLSFALSAFSFSAFAEDSKPTAVELCKQWDTEGKPADVDNLVYTDISKDSVPDDVTRKTNLVLKVVIGLTNATEERKNEIRAMVCNPDYIRFVDVKYSYDQLYEVYKEIWDELMPTGYVDMIILNTNLNHVTILFNDHASNDKRNHYLQEFQTRYGDMVALDNMNNDDTSSNSDSKTVGKPTAAELKKQWTEKGYPDDVGGFSFNYPSQTVVFLKNATDKRKEQISSMVSDPENLGFKDVKYSYKDLLAVLGEISKDFDSKEFVGKIDLWINEGSYVVVSIHPEVSDDDYNQFVDKYENLYGDKVTINDGTKGIREGGSRKSYPAPNYVLPEITSGSQYAKGSIWFLPCLITLVLIASSSVFLFLRSRRIRALQLANGVVIGDHKLSRIETEQAIKSMEESLDDAVWGSIMDEIEKK